MKKILKYSILISLGSFTLLYCAFLYFGSDFNEARRLKNRIESDFNISLQIVPEIIGREDYGWAEEGGDMALLKLSEKDFDIISKYLLKTDSINKNSDYYEMFQKYKITPLSALEYRIFNPHGDFTIYVLDIGSHILFIENHYE